MQMRGEAGVIVCMRASNSRIADEEPLRSASTEVVFHLLDREHERRGRGVKREKCVALKEAGGGYLWTLGCDTNVVMQKLRREIGPVGPHQSM